jgi:hypothetical protein
MSISNYELGIVFPLRKPGPFEDRLVADSQLVITR